MSLTINEVINATLSQNPKAASTRDMGKICLVTPEKIEDFDKDRYIDVADVKTVGELFGEDSETYKAASTAFGATAKPRNLMIGFADIAAKTTIIPEVMSSIAGAAYDLSVIDKIKALTATADTIHLSTNIAGAEVSISSPIAGIKSIDDLVDLIINAYADKNIEVSYEDNDKSLTLSCQVAEVNLTPIKFVSFTKEAEAETKAKTKESTIVDVDFNPVELLGLGDDAVITQYKAESEETEEPVETLTHALNEIENENADFAGVYLVGNIDNSKTIELHSWTLAASKPRICATTFTEQSELEGGIAQELADMSSGYICAQYNGVGDNYAGIALLCEALSTNWSGNNTAKTVKFKQQGNIKADSGVTLQIANKCRKLGINFYTYYDQTPMLAEGTMIGGRFIDEVVGLMAIQDEIQIAAFNVLLKAPKVPQTDVGQQQLHAAISGICEKYVRNGFLGEGIWRGVTIGTLLNGDAIANYHIHSDSYALQSQADREARKAMPITVCLKLSGAIHSADIIINFDR